MFGFEEGDRVKISEIGKKSFRGSDDKEGNVVGFKDEIGGEPMECVKVLWDCRILPTTLHYSFVEKV